MIKRKVSKVTRPNDGVSKPGMEAFRCSGEVKKLLKGVDNKSQFIEFALLEAFSKYKVVTCPLCKGKGRIGRERAKLRKVI